MDKREYLEHFGKFICPVCRKELEWFILVDNYNIHRCDSCYGEFVRPVPSLNHLTTFYQQQEYFNKERFKHNSERTIYSAVWTKRLKILSKLCASKANVLDVGCATGGFLRESKIKGWTIRGVEISEYASNVANSKLGKGTVVRAISELDRYELFDIISLWAYIEHIQDPRSELHQFYQKLNPGGILALSTPNTNSLSKKFLGQKWRYYLPPEHLNYFNRKNLTVLLHNCGFEVKKVRYVVVFKSYFRRGSKWLYCVEKHKTIRIILKVLYSPLLFLAMLFKLGDTLEMYAKKK